MQPTRLTGADAQLMNALRDLERAVSLMRASQEAFSAAPGRSTKLELFAAMAEEADSIAKVEILKQHLLHLPK